MSLIASPTDFPKAGLKRISKADSTVTFAEEEKGKTSH
jgi:hypothetical protein